MIFILLLGYIFLIPPFNSTHQGITKYLSPLANEVASVGEMTGVWIICLIIKWENFIFMQLIGFIISNFGFLLFAELFSIPGLDYNTRTNIQKRKDKSINSDQLVIT